MTFGGVLDRNRPGQKMSHWTLRTLDTKSSLQETVLMEAEMSGRTVDRFICAELGLKSEEQVRKVSDPFQKRSTSAPSHWSCVCDQSSLSNSAALYSLCLQSCLSVIQHSRRTPSVAPTDLCFSQSNVMSCTLNPPSLTSVQIFVSPPGHFLHHRVALCC